MLILHRFLHSMKIPSLAIPLVKKEIVSTLAIPLVKKEIVSTLHQCLSIETYFWFIIWSNYWNKANTVPVHMKVKICRKVMDKSDLL